MLQTSEILHKLESIQNLPTLPDVIAKLEKEIGNPKADAIQVAGIIEDDPSIMTRVLKVVNSVFYSGAEPITSVQQAVARMGFNAVNNIAMSTSVFSTMEGAGEEAFNRREFWRHCVSTGIAAGVVYKHSVGNLNRRYTTDVLHLVGLIHDIGKIIYEQYFHEEFLLAVTASASSGVPLYESEREYLGVDHAWVGSWLGEKWNLSKELVEAIHWHHEPFQSHEDHRELVMLCHCANYICNLKRIGDGGDCVAPKLISEVWSQLGLSAEDVEIIVAEVEEESSKSEVLLSLI